MRILITGASGYIGNSVAKACQQRGHTVYGLVRSEKAAKALLQNEIIPVKGDLKNPKTYSKVLESVETVIHCALEISPEGIACEAKTLDLYIKTALAAHLPRTIVYTSGVWVYGNTGAAIIDESFPLNPVPMVKWRLDHENKVMQASSSLLRTVIIRPGLVYGGSGGLTSLWFNSGKNGTVTMVGEGNTHWGMIHVQDLAHAYALAVEQEHNKLILNITDGTRFTVKEMASAVTTATKSKLKALSPKEAAAQFDKPMAEALLTDQQFSNERAKRILGWQPYHTSFISNADIYYQAWLSKESDA